MESQKVAFKAHLSATTSALEEKFDRQIRTLTARIENREPSPVSKIFNDPSEAKDPNKSGTSALLNHQHRDYLEKEARSTLLAHSAPSTRGELGKRGGHEYDVVLDADDGNDDEEESVVESARLSSGTSAKNLERSRI